MPGLRCRRWHALGSWLTGIHRSSGRASGACESEIDVIDLNESAAQCFQWKAYLDDEFRDGLRYDDTVYPFQCPQCETVFTRLSGLFQHVYSKACSQGLYEGNVGKLVRWLEAQHNTSGSE